MSPNENHINKIHLAAFHRRPNWFCDNLSYFFFFACHHFMGHVFCKSSSCLTLIWFCQLLLLLVALFFFHGMWMFSRKLDFRFSHLCMQEANWLSKVFNAKNQILIDMFLFQNKKSESEREYYLPKMSMKEWNSIRITMGIGRMRKNENVFATY